MASGQQLFSSGQTVVPDSSAVVVVVVVVVEVVVVPGSSAFNQFAFAPLSFKRDLIPGCIQKADTHI